MSDCSALYKSRAETSDESKDKMAAGLLSVVCFLLTTRSALTNSGPASLPIRLSVENDLWNSPHESYSSSVVEGGVLLGALRRLQETQRDFKFTVKEDLDFGPMLESVNGVTGNEREQTYWEILTEGSGGFNRLDVGIGCYKPKANEHIVLRFSMCTQRR